jgi:hypothetical protein
VGFDHIRPRFKTKLTGAVTAEVIRRHLISRGLAVSARDVFVEGNPVEVDLLVHRVGAAPMAGIIYDPDDVRAVLEVKYSGVYDRAVLPALREKFDRLTKMRPLIHCVYVTVLERRGFRYAATTKALGYPAFTLHWYQRTREDAYDSGDWEKLVSYLQGLVGAA